MTRGLLCRDIVPLGHTKSSFNYSMDDKRVLNFENVVNDDDNIKQDISIDVYGRAEKEEEAEAAAAEQDKETEKVLPSIMVSATVSIPTCTAYESAQTASADPAFTHSSNPMSSEY